MDGSGDYTSDDEHLSLSTSLSFQCHFGSACPSSPNLVSQSLNAGQWKQPRYENENCIRPTHCYVCILHNILC